MREHTRTHIRTHTRPWVPLGGVGPMSVQYAVVAPTRKHYSPPKDPPKCMLYLLPYMATNLHISY